MHVNHVVLINFYDYSMPPKKQTRIQTSTRNEDSTDASEYESLDPMQQFINLLNDTIQVVNQTQPHKNHGRHVAPFKAIKGINLSEFKGSVDLIEAQAWVKEI